MNCNQKQITMKRKIKELEERIDELRSQLTEGRDYLMTVNADEVTVENALESFGFGRNGLKSY